MTDNNSSIVSVLRGEAVRFDALRSAVGGLEQRRVSRRGILPEYQGVSPEKAEAIAPSLPANRSHAKQSSSAYLPVSTSSPTTRIPGVAREMPPLSQAKKALASYQAAQNADDDPKRQAVLKALGVDYYV